MTKRLMPACYFPSTVLFLSRGLDSLRTTLLQCQPRFFYNLFDSSASAFHYLHQLKYQPELLNQYCMHEHNQAKNLPLMDHLISNELIPLYAELYNPARYAEISVAIVDYFLQDVSGIEFCRQMDNGYTKKILLIDADNQAEAIKAQKEGVIHQFIIRTEVNFEQRLFEAIEQMQWNYFQAMTDSVFRLLSFSSPTYLADETFLRLFRQLLVEYQAMEFYLIDKTGGFLLLDKPGNAGYLIVRTQEEIKSLCSVIAEFEVSDVLLNRLTVGDYVTSFNKYTDMNEIARDWPNHLYPAKRFEENDTVYYYAFLAADRVCTGPYYSPSYQQYSNDLMAESALLA